MYLCVCACVRVCVCMCMCVRVSATVQQLQSRLLLLLHALLAAQLGQLGLHVRGLLGQARGLVLLERVGPLQLAAPGLGLDSRASGKTHLPGKTDQARREGEREKERKRERVCVCERERLKM